MFVIENEHDGLILIVILLIVIFVNYKRLNLLDILSKNINLNL